MNVVRKFAVFVHTWVLGLLLFAVVMPLAAQLSWPAMGRWWRLPDRGQIGLDSYPAAALAGEYVICLHARYRDRQSLPLVIFLRGSGHRGTDPTNLCNQVPFGHKLAAIVVAPQCRPTE